MSSMMIGILLITIASVITCHGIAKSRGAKPVFWGLIGALFGPFAIPFAFFC